MNEEKGRVRDGRGWIFIVALVLMAAFYGYLQYELKYDPSSLRQDTKDCDQGYANSRSARDTAHVDSMTPRTRVYVRSSSMRTCGYYREHGSIRPSLR